MSNFKRKKPKSRANYCKMCKYWRTMGNSKNACTHQELKQLAAVKEQLQHE